MEIGIWEMGLPPDGWVRFFKVMSVFLLLVLLALVFLGLNLWYFFRRPWEASFWQVSYATAYYSKDAPVIRDWREVEGGIEGVLVWDAPVKGWKITKEGEPYSENEGPNPVFPMDANDTEMRLYHAQPQPGHLFGPLPIKIRFMPRKLHIERGLPRPDSYLIYTDVPNGAFKQYAVSDFVDDYEWMPRDHLEAVDQILKEKVGIREADTVFEKLEKIMIFQRDDLGQQCRGTPPLRFRPLNPYELYVDMRDGKGKGWCTQQGQIFNLFATRAGVRCRLVQGAKTKNNNTIFSGHTWNEAWIPEQGRWAWIDPSPALIYATNREGKVLNTVEMAQLRLLKAWDGVRIRTYKDWQWPDLAGEPNTLVDARYEEVGDVVERQFIRSAIYKWRRPPHVEDLRYEYGDLLKNKTFAWGNLVRYWFKPPLAYADYPTEGNRTYFLRHLFLWGFLGSVLAAAIAML